MKTLSDLDVTAVSMVPVSTTVSLLNLAPGHCSGGPDNHRAYPEELQVFEVVGRITYVRLEDDRDYHVAISDPFDPTATVVTEVADPGCSGAAASPYSAQLAAARAAFEAFRAGRDVRTLVGETVRLRGVGFYDFNHGQNGRSRSCIELHPVLGIERVG